MRLASARTLVVALWAGSLWSVGYLVAPILSATLDDRKQFGNIAAAIFRGEAFLTLACALLMLLLLSISGRAGELLDAARKRSLMRLVLLMLACTLLGYFGVQPVMAALRAEAGPGPIMDTALRTQFGILHGVAAVFYLIQSILAGFLVVKNR